MKPFDLAAALAGEPVVLRNGNKANVMFRTPCQRFDNETLVGYSFYDRKASVCMWTLDGRTDTHSDSLGKFDIIGMWEEPSQVVTLNMPVPVRSIADLCVGKTYWLVNNQTAVVQYRHTISDFLTLTEFVLLVESGRVYTTEAAANQAAVEYKKLMGKA